jgi:quercetin dioxygenase-like cupin family protein
MMKKGESDRMVNVVRASDVEPLEMAPGVWRRTLSWGERIMAVQVVLEEGAAVPAHRHPHEQSTYIVEGELSMDVEGRTHILLPGDALVFPANVEHGAIALKRTVVVDSFSPPREEFK